MVMSNLQNSLSESESETRFLGGFSKVLALYFEVTDGESVPGYEALHGSRAVLNRELGTICLIGVGELRIIFGVEEACDRRALHAGNPEVARTRYK